MTRKRNRRNPRKYRAVVGTARRRGKVVGRARVGKATVRILKNRRGHGVRASRRERSAVGSVTVRVQWFQGWADHVGYKHTDGKLYRHDFETPDAAHVYLAESPRFGRCILIVDPAGTTPLWGE